MLVALVDIDMSSLRAPWIKRIDLETGEATVLSLDPAERMVTARVREVTDCFEFDGVSWFHVGHRWLRPPETDDGDDDGADAGEAIVDRRWAIHGTTASSRTALFTFMEYPEARHAQLESSLATEASALFVYADWLEEHGDPYAAALNPELLKERGPAGHWFLEGLDRSGLIEFTLRDALVREVKLGSVPDTSLAETMHRLCHLRACVALEHVSMQRAKNPPRWQSSGADATSELWRQCRWPASLRRVTVSGNTSAAEALEKDLRRTNPLIRVAVA